MKAVCSSPEIRNRIKFCIWLFLALCGLAVLSPVTSVDDEMQHLGAIWCAHGVDGDRCIALTEGSEEITSGYLMPNSDLLGEDTTIAATTNLDFRVCRKGVIEIYNCPTSQAGISATLISSSVFYTGWTYKLMHLAVGDDVEQSVVRIRILTALIVSLVFLALLLLPNRRTGVVVVGAMLVCMLPFGWYLASSVNPSGLAAVGVATSWVFAHSLIVDEYHSVTSRAGSLSMALVAAFLAVGTRLDSAAFLLLTYVCLLLVIIASGARRKTGSRAGKFSMAAGALAAASIGALVLRTIDLAAITNALFAGDSAGVNNLVFFSHHLLQVVPIWFQATGSVSAHSGVMIPQVSGLIATLLLGILFISNLKNPNVRQLNGLVFSLLAAASINILWTGVFDSRTLFGPSVRYTFPLLLFCAVWVVTFSTHNLVSMYRSAYRAFEVAYLVSFGLSTYTIAERYVDRQSFGLRILPEGLDQWWWSWLPIGPNAVVIVSVYCMYRALASYRQLHTGIRASA